MPSSLTEAIQIATTVAEVEAVEAWKTHNKEGNLFAICFNCKKPGHIAKNCYQRKQLVNNSGFRKQKTSKITSRYTNRSNTNNNNNNNKSNSPNNNNRCV